MFTTPRSAPFLATILLMAAGQMVRAQSIPRHDMPRLVVEQFEEKGDDGMVTLVFGVTMTDCIRTVEVENLANHRKTVYAPTMDYYYVREGEMEELYAKVPLGKFGKLVDDVYGMRAVITIVSKTGQTIYHGITVLKPMQEPANDTRTAAK